MLTPVRLRIAGALLRRPRAASFSRPMISSLRPEAPSESYPAGDPVRNRPDSVAEVVRQHPTNYPHIAPALLLVSTWTSGFSL